MSWISRQWQRLREKILREQATPEFIAKGWAIGMFYGCAIPFGFQLILSIPTAIVLKGSKIGATVGTFVTNHFSIFIIYPFSIINDITNTINHFNISCNFVHFNFCSISRNKFWFSVSLATVCSAVISPTMLSAMH